MLIEITTYHRYINYWNNYGDEIKLEMISAILKSVVWAWVDFTQTKKLYAVYLKDGEKIYTDYAGFRRIMKAARANKVEFHVL
jgi:hypothetical protein